jgi:hypothetical protein
MGWKFVWPTLILIMKINVGSRRLLWPILVGLFNVVIDELVEFVEIVSSNSGCQENCRLI